MILFELTGSLVTQEQHFYSVYFGQAQTPQSYFQYLNDPLNYKSQSGSKASENYS